MKGILFTTYHGTTPDNQSEPAGDNTAGIALLVDRSIQDGPGRAVGRIKRLAKDAGIALPFSGPAQERKLAEYIVEKGRTPKDHKKRVKLLLEDKYRLLTVNLYDWETYGVEYDV